MTTIYIPLRHDGYQFCHPINTDDFAVINNIVNGMQRKRNWLPVKMHIINKDQGRDLLESDSPWFESNALIFNKTAIELLEPLLLEHGELLPIQCRNAVLSIYNPTNILMALDEELSTALRFSSGKIMAFKKYVFREEVVKGSVIFKIPNIRVSPTFVDQHFVDQWQLNRLRGLDFIKIWSSS